MCIQISIFIVHVIEKVPTSCKIICVDFSFRVLLYFKMINKEEQGHFHHRSM